MSTLKLSGLEVLEKFKDGAFPPPTMATTIPVRITEVKKGFIEFGAVANDMHLNPMGGVHGGFAATVLDSATGSAVHSLLLPGESYGTVELNVKMLKPVPQGAELRARGKVIHLSRRLGTQTFRKGFQMEESNPVFKKNYCGYLQKLDKVDFSLGQSVLAIEVDEERKTAQIPFFQTRYQVSQEGVVDNRGKRPDYGICVILLKYLLMCPKKIPPEDDWVAFRELKDSGLTKNGALSDYAMKTISTLYAGNKSRLKAAVRALGGRRPETDYPYDLSAVFTVLPRIPILFLYNDADRQFPAQASILFERRAERFLDPECLVMIGFYLSKHLKRAEK